MRTATSRTLATLLFVLLAAGVRAQTPTAPPSPFALPYQYSDVNGPGVLTLTPLSSAGTQLSFQPIQVTLDHNNIHSIGSGVYHAFADDQANLPTVVLLSFTLQTPSGASFFFQATMTLGGVAAAPGTFPGGYVVNGTYWPVASPLSPVAWSATPQAPPPVVNDSPALVSFWEQRPFSEAIGGAYFATFNTFQIPDSTATWSGLLTVPGRYQVEVFIPIPATPGTVPRTNHAVYQVAQLPGPAGAVSPGLPVGAPPPVNQQVTASAWIPLGTFFFQQGYQIVLTDTTGEPQGTRSVVADAVRLTLVATGP